MVAGLLLLAHPLVAAAAGPGEVLRLRGETLAATGRCEEAVGWLDRARAADPGDAQAALSAGKCQIVLGRYADAVASLRDASRLAPSDEATLYLGIALYHLDDFDAASVELDKAVSALPDRAEAHLYTGLIALRRGQAATAATSLSSARRINPGSVEPIASFYEGMAEQANGERRKAEAALKRARELGAGTVWEAQATAALDQLEGGTAPTWKAVSPRDLEILNEKSTRWWLTASVGFEYDDNVVLRGDGVDLPTSEGDELGVYWAEAGYELYSDPDWTVGILASYYGNAHDDLEDFDIHFPGASLWVDRRLGPTSIARLQYDFGYAFIGDAWVGDADDYLRSHTWTPAIYQDWGDWGNTRFFARLGLRNYLYDNDDVLDGNGVGQPCPLGASLCGPAGISENTERNSDGFLVVTGFDHSVSAFGDGTTFRAGYHFHNYDARGTEYSYDAHEILFGVRQLLPFQFAFEVYGSYMWKPYANPSTYPDPNHVVSGLQYRLSSNDRYDEVARVDVSLERPITDEVTLSARYSYLNNDSNVDVFDYDRHLVGVYATLRFSP